MLTREKLTIDYLGFCFIYSRIRFCYCWTVKDFSFETNGTVLKGGFLALGAAVLTAISVLIWHQIWAIACQKIKEIGEDVEELLYYDC